MIGRVVSVKMNKTASILVEGEKEHPLYKKRFIFSKKYLVDDQKGVKLGDIVEVTKIRPVSRRKHWTISKVLGKDIVAVEETALAEVSEEAIAEVLLEEKENESSEEIKGDDVKEKKAEVKKKVSKKETK